MNKKTPALFKITGGRPLQGTFSLNGNKNSVFPIVAAATLCLEPVSIVRIPNIGDVRSMSRSLESIGITCELSNNELIVDASLRNVDAAEQFANRAESIRAAILFAPMLMKRKGKKVLIPYPGGDRIGSRPMDVHLYVLREMGVDVEETEDGYLLNPKDPHAANLWLSEPSVTATELAILMAASVEGKTRICNYAMEPHVHDLCRFVQDCGVKINSDFPGNLLIDSCGMLDYDQSESFEIGYDFMEMGSIVASVALAGGEVNIVGWRNPDDFDFVDPIMIARLYQSFGVNVVTNYEKGVMKITSERSKLHIPGTNHKIKPGPWPSLNTDLIPPALAVASVTEGQTHVHEWMFDGRLAWLEQLRHMGAHIEIMNRHEAIITGKPTLVAPTNTIETPDIRAGMAILVAALGAEGTSFITTYQIDRGYERIDERLNALRAQIERVP